MARIQSFDLYAVDLPFRRPFKHSAAERSCSNSLFLCCRLDSGIYGYGESLPREYVTGESRDWAFALLRDEILPQLVGRNFGSAHEVAEFLGECDGKTPGWVDSERPQGAAWSTVDLSLLDTFGRACGSGVFGSDLGEFPPDLRYSGVLSSNHGLRLIKSCLAMRLYGLRSVKMKVGRETPNASLRQAAWILGAGALRVDANMAWTVEEAVTTMRNMAKVGIEFFEQPVACRDFEGLSRLVAETGLEVMADESLTDAGSLQDLLAHSACTAINVRISKCGGIIASRNRCREALASGLKVQIGCQVGESSLLSSAQLALAASVQDVIFVEGCFGTHLLRQDPVSPLLQFGYAGRAPKRPRAAGLGVQIDERMLREFATARAQI